MVRVEDPRAADAKEMAPGVPVHEKIVEAPTLMGALDDALSRAALTPGTMKGPSFNPSWEAALDDVTSVPVSFDIVDLGTGEPGLPGYP
jgi:hypothetical protein